MGGQAKFAENIHATQFNEDRSNENTFSLIHLDSTFKPLKNLCREGYFLLPFNE